MIIWCLKYLILSHRFKTSKEKEKIRSIYKNTWHAFIYWAQYITHVIHNTLYRYLAPNTRQCALMCPWSCRCVTMVVISLTTYGRNSCRNACILRKPHKTYRIFFGYILTHWSSHCNLTLVKVAQILELFHFLVLTQTSITNSLLSACQMLL